MGYWVGMISGEVTGTVHFLMYEYLAPSHQSYQNTSLSQCYKKNEREKSRAYDQRIREVSMDPSLP